MTSSVFLFESLGTIMPFLNPSGFPFKKSTYKQCDPFIGKNAAACQHLRIPNSELAIAHRVLAHAIHIFSSKNFTPR